MTGLIHRSQSAGSSARVHSGNDRERARGGARPPALRPPPKGGSRECRWPERYLGLPARSPIAVADRDLWPGRDRGAARQARQRGGQDNRVEEFGAARLPAANQARRFADCRRLSCRDQYASGAAGTLGRLWRGDQQEPAPAKAGDTVSRVWRKVKGDWDAWNARSLAEEPIIRLILDGTVVRVRLDRKATSIVLLVALGIREDGQKVLLAVKNMGGETSEAWRAVLDDLVKRGLRKPEFLIVACPGEGRGRHWAGAGVGRPLGRRADPALHRP